MQIQIPHKFDPRPHQYQLLEALDSGYKRAIAVYHRRAGKDLIPCHLGGRGEEQEVGTSEHGPQGQ